VVHHRRGGIFGKVWNPAANQFGALSFIYGTASRRRSPSSLPSRSAWASPAADQVVPYRWARPIVYVIDLLAWVPSVVWPVGDPCVRAPGSRTVYSSIRLSRQRYPVLGALVRATNERASFFTAGIILAFIDHADRDGRCRAR